MNSYEAKQERRRERLEAAADKARREADRRYGTASSIADGIPMGQPVLVGHHSEKRHRRDLARIDANMRASIEASKRAEDLERRAAGVGTAGISSDDPDATAKLRDQLAKLERNQALYRDTNKALRKGDDDALRALGYSDAQIAELRKPDFAGRVGVPDYMLSNNSANMRRIKQRIAALDARGDMQTTERAGEGWRLVENVEANRLQLFFDDIPPAAVRQALKGAGFRWARSAGAWQRHLSPAARWQAERVLATL